MDVFLKAVAAVLISVVVCLLISKQGKEFSIALTLGVSCMVIIVGFAYLRPVIEFIKRLSVLGQLNSQTLSIILKSVGIAMLAEISELVCKDAGNSTLGKALQILAVAAILWLSIPLFNELIDLVESIFNMQ